MKKTLLFFLFIFNILQFHASHVPGGNITYECIGPNTYVVTLTLFEDCGTAFTTNAPEPINVTNTCGLTMPSTISLPNIIFQEVVNK